MTCPCVHNRQHALGQGELGCEGCETLIPPHRYDAGMPTSSAVFDLSRKVTVTPSRPRLSKKHLAMWRRGLAGLDHSSLLRADSIRIGSLLDGAVPAHMSWCTDSEFGLASFSSSLPPILHQKENRYEVVSMFVSSPEHHAQETPWRQCRKIAGCFETVAMFSRGALSQKTGM